MKSTLFVCVPFTGLGLYSGFRGDRWLRNRIKVFEQFVVPSLLAQSDQDFVLWVAWREEEKGHPYVESLYWRLKERFNVVFTYTGCPMWDDKYPDDVARERLSNTLRGAMPVLMDFAPDAEEIYWLLQPSDDCYDKNTFFNIKANFANTDAQVISYQKGYLCNYNTKEVVEYNPKTNPPFFCVRYPRSIFFDPGKHMNWTGPFKSHEYIGEKLRIGYLPHRGFLVGTHGENISTHFNHPYGGDRVSQGILESFGLDKVEKLKLPFSIRKWIMRNLPHPIRRKIRYWFGELFWNKIYEYLRK